MVNRVYGEAKATAAVTPLKSLLPKPRDWGWLVLGAALVPLAYPPLHLLIPSFVCLVPAAILLMRGSSEQRPGLAGFAQGFWFGLLSNVLLLYWMPVALWRYTPLATPAFALATIGLGVYTGVTFGLTRWVVRKTGLPMVVVLPTLWTAKEWLLGHQGLISLPWLGLGTSLTGFPALIQVADIVGARGLTWLLVAANVALAQAWIHRRKPAQAIVLTGCVATAIGVSLGYGIARARSITLRNVGTVVLIQPNVGYLEKWDPARADSIVAALVNLSDSAVRVTQPELVIWPESAIPGHFAYRPGWEAMVSSHSRKARTPLILGALDVQQAIDGETQSYNAAYQFSRLGLPSRTDPYHKQRTVLFVERFAGIGSGDTTPTFTTDIGRYGVLICYESAFEELARKYRTQGSDFLVNISNDAWFGGTTGPFQHESHVIMRAIENRIGIARAANNGISELVDPLGRRRHATEFGTETFVAGDLLTSDVVTLYTSLGDWTGTLSVFGALAMCGYAVALRRR